MVRAMQALVKTVALLAALGVALGLFPALHPLADDLSTLRLPLAVLAALAAIWSDWPARLRWPLAGLMLSVLGWMALTGVAA